MGRKYILFRTYVNIDRFAGSHGRKGEGGRGWHQGKRADTSLHSMIYDGTFGVNS